MRDKKILGSVGLMALFWPLVLGSPAGANSSGGAPTVMCMECHILPKGAEIQTENMPRAFEPGAVYEIGIKVVSGVLSVGDVHGGFAAIASDGELIVADPVNTQKSDAFITHTAEGTHLRSWKIKWKAPQQKKTVTLTISVIAANGDFVPVNDGFARREFIISPK